MNTYAPSQKRLHNANALHVRGTGKQLAAGIGLPLFMQGSAATTLYKALGGGWQAASP